MGKQIHSSVASPNVMSPTSVDNNLIINLSCKSQKLK